MLRATKTVEAGTKVSRVRSFARWRVARSVGISFWTVGARSELLVQTFQCGSGMTDKQRKNPPKIGSIIVYKFMELTESGVPRFVPSLIVS